MGNGVANRRSIYQVVSLVLMVVNVVGVLACLVWSLHLRQLFLEDYRKFGGELPLSVRLVVGAHWSLWCLAALAVIALLVVKERLRRRWIPLLLNAITIPALAVYVSLFSFSMLTASSPIISSSSITRTLPVPMMCRPAICSCASTASSGKAGR